MANLDKRLKGFIRYDGSGRVVPSSLILRRKMPKTGNWVEVPVNKCCNPTTTTTTTTEARGETTTTTTTTEAPTTTTTTTEAPTTTTTTTGA